MRKKEKPAAFQFYPRDYLSDINVEVMTLEEEGIYIRLLSYCWLQQRLPNDPEILRQLAKGASAETIGRVVRTCFKVDPKDNTKLFHARLEFERKKQKEWQKKSSEGGKKSAKARWGKKLRGEGWLPNGYDLVEPNGNSSSSSSSSSAIEKHSHSPTPLSQAKEGGESKSPARAPKPKRTQPVEIPVSSPELWKGLLFAADQAGLGVAKGQLAKLAQTFGRLPTAERQAAIEGIETRLESGEYGNGFTPNLKRYLGEKLWTARLRLGPRKFPASEARPEPRGIPAGQIE